MANVDKNVMF